MKEMPHGPADGWNHHLSEDVPLNPEAQADMPNIEIQESLSWSEDATLPHLEGLLPAQENISPPDIGPGHYLTVQRFDTETPDPERRAAVLDRKDATVDEAIQAHADYTDYAGREDNQYHILGLTYNQEPGERVDVNVSWNESFRAIDLHFVYGGTRDGITYSYDVSKEGDAAFMQRNELASGIVFKDLPRAGTLPAREIDKQHAAALRAETENVALEREFGLRGKEVGETEMRYVQEIVRRAEPHAVSYKGLREVAYNRMRASGDRPSDEDARSAGQTFVTSVQRFLHEHGGTLALTSDFIEPSSAAAIQIRVDSPEEDACRSTVAIHFSTPIKAKDGSTETLREKGYDRGIFRETILYRLYEGRLVTDLNWSIANPEGKVVDTYREVANADATESSFVRNFLRKPVFSLVTNDELITDDWH
jgi:hypothetical protein